MSSPLVSIGLTAYNAEDTIEKAVSSALDQSWRPIEIVAVDDNSTDGTWDVLRRLADEYNELRVLRNAHNGGVAISRNRIVEEAQGEFIAFFDDDDQSHPDRISKQIERITAYEKSYANGLPVICHTARNVHYPDGQVLWQPTMGMRVDTLAPSGVDVARRILMGTPLDDAYGACPTCCQAARVSTYRALGGFNPTFRRSEDTEFNVRLAMAGGHFVGLQEPLVEQMMTKTSEKSLDGEFKFTLMLLDENRGFLQQEGQYEFCRNWVHMKHDWLKGRRMTFFVRLFALLLRYPRLSYRRLMLARQNVVPNKAFSRFHGGQYD